MKVWSIPAMRYQSTLVGHMNWIRSAHFSPDIRSALSASDDKTARVWDIRSRQCVHAFEDFTGSVLDARFHPDGQCIATATDDALVQLWDTRGPGLLQHYNAHDDTATSVSFHTCGSFLLSSSRDGTAKVWDLKEGQLFYTLYGHSGTTEVAHFSPDGDYFATAGSDCQALVWRTNFDQSEVKPRTRPYSAPKANRARHDSQSNAQREITQQARPGTAHAHVAEPTAHANADHPPSSSEHDAHRERAASVNAQGVFDKSGKALDQASARHVPPSVSIPHAAPLQSQQSQQQQQDEQGTATTMEQVLSKLDVLTQTVGMMEKRLSLTEEKVNRLARKGVSSSSGLAAGENQDHA
jgi:centriolar protein POC1